MSANSGPGRFRPASRVRAAQAAAPGAALTAGTSSSTQGTSSSTQGPSKATSAQTAQAEVPPAQPPAVASKPAAAQPCPSTPPVKRRQVAACHGERLDRPCQSSLLPVLPGASAPSGIACFLEEQQAMVVDNEEALEASLADTVDEVLRAQHVMSERKRPRASDLRSVMPLGRRAELVVWMMQSFDILQLDDEFLHSVAQTLDRYYALHSAPVDNSVLQYVLLAAVCTELKTAGGDDYPEPRWKRYVSHLCQGRVPLISILKMESQVLARLDYVVGLPTPVTFLKSLCIGLQSNAMEPLWSSLATFVLELALFDPDLEYSHPHSHLAAGALSVAFRVLDAPCALREDLLADVAACWPSESCASEQPGGFCKSSRESVLDCEEDLLHHWLQCSLGRSEYSEFYVKLQAKYSCHARHAVGQLLPTKALKQLREERACGGKGKASP